MVYKPKSPTGCGLLKPPPKIEINIRSNTHNCGKTTIASIIHKALKEAGVSEVDVVCSDGDFDNIARNTINGKTGVIIDNKIKQTRILIMDTNEMIND